MSNAPLALRRRVAAGSFGLAGLVALASLGGLLLPDTYAAESAGWRAQALGQDWFDLAVAVPWLVLCAAGTMRGRGHWHLLLGGALLYVIYTFVIYAFAVHFNGLFLIYCAALGLASYLTLFLVHRLGPADARPRTDRPLPVRSAGLFLIAVGGVFALLWLGEILPALAARDLPASVAEAGLFTNPVHVIDLSLVLPAHLVAGIALLRRRPAGPLLAALLLAFGAPMAASIGGMVIVMHLAGAPAALPVAAAMLAVSGLSVVLLARLLRALAPAG